MTDNNQTELYIPDELPILPLRGVVVYPMMWLPLTIGQERSIRLVDDALLESSEQRIIGLFTSKNPEAEEPGPDGVSEIGTAAVCIDAVSARRQHQAHRPGPGAYPDQTIHTDRTHSRAG
jgi:ATP-dependent Lon protease